MGTPGSSTGTKTTTKAAPALPEAAKAHNAFGAQAFARYWFEVVNYTFESRDTTALRSLSLPSCTFCRNLAEAVDARRRRGEVYVNGVFAVREAVSPGLDGSGSAVVDVLVRVAPSQIVGAAGNPIERDPGADALLTNVSLRPTAVGWAVENVVAQN